MAADLRLRCLAARRYASTSRGVVYGGTNSSVRCSGADYDDNTVSGQPFINVKTLEISKVNIASNTNFTFNFVAQNTASTASESPYTPTFGDITDASFKFEVGVNGTWYPVAYSVMALNGSAAWHQCTAMFKLPADVQTGELAFRWSGFTGGTTLRVDDLKLYEGGEGAVLGGGENPGPGDTYTFTKVSNVTSGKKYLIVADGKEGQIYLDELRLPAGGRRVGCRRQDHRKLAGGCLHADGCRRRLHHSPVRQPLSDPDR